MDIAGYLLTGATAAAVVKLIDNLLQWFLTRKAKREDKEAAKKEENEKSAEQRIKDMEQSLNAVVEGQKYILLDRIRYLGCTYLKDGEVSFEDRRLLNMMHGVYHNGLGGNGDLDNLMEEVNDLPLKQ
jgi:hypothetical protein